MKQFDDFLPEEQEALSHVHHFFNMVADVLVIGAIIGASILLFLLRARSTNQLAAGSMSEPIIAQAGGLSASMQINAGPYFLSEMIATNVSLTNNTQTDLLLEGFPLASMCGDSAIQVILGDGNAPHFTDSITGIGKCAPPDIMHLAPGNTVAIHDYLLLTSSGRVMLMFQAKIVTEQISDNTINIQNGHSPLDGYWPSIAIYVDAHVPADRKLSFQHHGNQVIVNAPLAARNYLVYRENISCGEQSEPGNSVEVTKTWTPLSTNGLNLPPCDQSIVKWTYAVSAPGYAVASESVAIGLSIRATK